jgi:enoyl-CoA hydratase/carnithine racemase
MRQPSERVRRIAAAICRRLSDDRGRLWTLSATKQALARLQRRLSREEGEDLILMCYMSRDFREGLDAFLNKRQPQWVGE